MKEQKIPVNLGLVGVTEGRVPVASRPYSYSKSATTRRSGRVTGAWAGTKRGEEGEGALQKIWNIKIFFLKKYPSDNAFSFSICLYLSF